MNCPRCGREMLVSHVNIKIEDGEEKAEKVYSCVNINCSEHREDCRIKIKEG